MKKRNSSSKEGAMFSKRLCKPTPGRLTVKYLPYCPYGWFQTKKGKGQLFLVWFVVKK